MAKSNGRNIILFFGPGADFQPGPPTPSELKREGSTTPALTPSAADLTEHCVKRSARVFTR